MINPLPAQENQQNLRTLEVRLGYRFSDPGLLQKALVHSSYAFEQGGESKNDNETMEFLGDAVLDLAIGHALYRHYPEMREGDLTRLRAALVNERHLAQMAREVELGLHLMLGKGEEGSRGREKDSILSCAYEAVVGAIFLDAGYPAAALFVESHFIPWFARRQQSLFLADAKSSLQELLQERFSEGPRYMLDGAEGPDHDKTFHVTVWFHDRLLGSGSARSKKEAEQLAAAEALQNVAVPDPDTP